MSFNTGTIGWVEMCDTMKRVGTCWVDDTDRLGRVGVLSGADAHPGPPGPWPGFGLIFFILQ